MALSQREGPSVIIFRLQDMRPITVQIYLVEILNHHSDVLEQGIVASVSERRIRVRHLPI